MSGRHLTVLGTASQAPTRSRAGGGSALQWDDQLILFDPAEGYQRQCLLAGVAIGRATALCITHFHGDHCLGLPGVIQRRALSQCDEPLPVYFPAEGLGYYHHLVQASIYDNEYVEPIPVSGPGEIGRIGRSVLLSQPLQHRVPTIGYRVQEPDRTGLAVERLERMQVTGRQAQELSEVGRTRIGGRSVTVEEVAELRPGQSMAFVMDTTICDGAVALADHADLLVCEATYLERDGALARQGSHLTARQAAWLARESGARRLVLTHFSGRYDEVDEFEAEASEIHDDVVVARDLDVIAVPARHRAPVSGRGQER